MKNAIIASLLFLLFNSGFAQNSGRDYTGRQNPSMKKEKLSVAKTLGDIIPAEEYNKLVDNVIFEAVEISATCNGKVLVSQSSGDKLNTAQINIVNMADLGSDIDIKVNFKYKGPVSANWAFQTNQNKLDLLVTVVPEIEAGYPGGNKQINYYLKENVIGKMAEAGISDKLPQVTVAFAINEEGQIVDARISRSSTDPKMDKLLFDAINSMPKWSPAENSKGVKIKQEFKLSIPFYVTGC